MPIDDPFSRGDEADRTVIRPRPGGRRPPEEPAPASASQPVSASPAPQPQPGYQTYSVSASPGDFQGLHVGMGPLVSAATSLLTLAPQLRSSTRTPNVSGLRDYLTQEIRVFEQKARQSGASEETTLAGRYVLCTYLDESVMVTPWGGESNWGSRTLLSGFHNETWGGEKSFAILQRALQEPARMIDVLELIYVCLALGFEGQYRVLEGGRSRLQDIQEQTYRAIRSQRGEPEHDLSAQWRGVAHQRNPLVRYVPLWVVGAIAGAVLMVMYIGFAGALHSRTDPAYQQLEKIRHGYAGRRVDDFRSPMGSRSVAGKPVA
ncbi:MAG: type IVB secretion system protein IcmH/DotU [Gammaproteobacteria bacterium]|nr:type IVB secretion system protein IcmH/DotU [Gammaproteobacteria bacterium]